MQFSHELYFEMICKMIWGHSNSSNPYGQKIAKKLQKIDNCSWTLPQRKNMSNKYRCLQYRVGAILELSLVLPKRVAKLFGLFWSWDVWIQRPQGLGLCGCRNSKASQSSSSWQLRHRPPRFNQALIVADAAREKQNMLARIPGEKSRFHERRKFFWSARNTKER